MFEPCHGRVYDDCCGSDGMFLQSERFVEEHQGNIKGLSIFGQESNPTTLRLAKMHLTIRGIDARKTGSMINRHNKEFSDDDIALITDTYHAWRNIGEQYEDKAGFCDGHDD